MPCVGKVVVWPPDVSLGGIDNGVGVFLDDGEVALNPIQSPIGQLVGLLNVWLRIVVWSLEVGLDGLAEAGVGTVCDLERLLAVWVLLEGLDAVVDGRVGGEVVEELAGRLVAVGEGLGCVRHLEGRAMSVGVERETEIAIARGAGGVMSPA